MTVQEFMQKSGIPIKLKGYEFVKRAIEIKLENPDKNMSQIKMQVGNEFGVTATSIEKCIIWAIENSFEQMDSRLKNTMFDYCGNFRLPATKEYVDGVAYAISHELI